jgi:hypothetical protein
VTQNLTRAPSVGNVRDTNTPRAKPHAQNNTHLESMKRVWSYERKLLR